MLERERLLSQMTDHRILLSDRLKAAIPRRDGSWFDLHGRSFNPTDLSIRLPAVTQAGLDFIPIRESPLPTATQILRKARRRRR